MKITELLTQTIKPGDILTIETLASALVGTVVGVSDDIVIVEGDEYSFDDDDSKVIKIFGRRQAVKNRTPYRYNPDIAKQIPKYDSVKRRNIPAGFEQDNTNAVAYARFEAVPVNARISHIVGVAPDGGRVVVSTTTGPAAIALADAYNRGGFTDQDIERVRFDEVKQRLDPKCWKGYRKQGTKIKNGVRVNNCVKINETIDNYYALFDAIDDIETSLQAGDFDAAMWDFDQMVIYCQENDMSMQTLIDRIAKNIKEPFRDDLDFQTAYDKLTSFGKLFNDNKNETIRALLQRIKDASSYITAQDVSFIVKSLRQLGVDWPELDLIVAATRQSLPRTLDESDMDEEEEELYYDAINHMENLYHALTGKQWRSAAEHLAELGSLYQDLGVYLPTAIGMVTSRQVKMHIEKIYGLLDDNKKNVLRGILTMIKNGHETANSVGNLISVLDVFGADWPELDTLEAAAIKSLPGHLNEAEYQGRKVQLGKPMRGDVKKYKVFVKDPKTGNIKKVNFGDPNMEIKRDDPKRRKSFRARHGCGTPRASDRTKAAYWSCRLWSNKPVSKILKGK